MFLLRRRSAVVSGHVGDDHLFGWRHPQQLGVQDQVVRMLVVLAVADVIPDVVEERGIGEELAVPRGASQPVA
jgi:hypothetical protein